MRLLWVSASTSGVMELTHSWNENYWFLLEQMTTFLKNVWEGGNVTP